MKESIVEKAGYKEYSFDTAPDWKFFRYFPYLPNPIAKTVLQKKLKRVNISSMQQDLERGRPTELESINGELVKLAEKVGAPAPLNTELLELCRSYFKQSPYIQTTWDDLKDKLTTAEP